MNNLDLECGGGRRSSTMSDADDDASVCFSEGEEEGSCYSQFYSTADGSIDGYNIDSQIDQVSDSRRVSSVVGSDCSVDIGHRLHEFRILLDEMMQRDCRICHLNLDDGSDFDDSNFAIELGCSCKNDLAAAHQHCAETWFKMKGNKICEICHTIAQNVIIPTDIEFTEQLCVINPFPTNAVVVPPAPSTIRSRAFIIGHRFVNFVLACIVFAFFLAWLFHFHMPS